MKIVVLAGGLSTERDVSLITGSHVCKALKKRGHKAVLLDVFLGYESENNDISGIFDDDFSSDAAEITEIDPDLDKVKALRGGDTVSFFGPNVIDICRMADMVYMALHGADGENGKIQAAFDLLGIKYTGSDYLGSAMAMDKGMSKKIFMTGGIPTPKGYCLNKHDKMIMPDELGYPCIVKPCCGGSSVGVSIANNEEEYKKALEIAFKYEDEVVVEEFIKGREFSVGVIGGKSLPIIEIIPKTGFYDYKTKYQSGMAEDVCPADLTEEQTDRMQAHAIDVYRELKLGTYARIDFLLDAKGDMYCLEANTLPGMTATSLLPQEAKALGIKYEELCEIMIAEAMYKYKGGVEELPAVGHNRRYTLDDIKKPEDVQ